MKDTAQIWNALLLLAEGQGPDMLARVEALAGGNPHLRPLCYAAWDAEKEGHIHICGLPTGHKSAHYCDGCNEWNPKAHD